MPKRKHIWSYIRVKGYSTPNKVVVCKNGIPVMVCNGEPRASSIISYAEGYTKGDDLLDLAAKRIIDRERGASASYTQLRKQLADLLSQRSIVEDAITQVQNAIILLKDAEKLKQPA